MDQNFVTRRGRYASPSAGLGDFNISREQADEEHASKQRAARRLLARFAAQRPADRFSMIAFSTLPIGCSTSPRARGRCRRRSWRGDRPRAGRDRHRARAARGRELVSRPANTGSRIIVLVSDGGDILDAETREEVGARMRDYRVTLYWLYIRSARGAGLRAERGERTEAGRRRARPRRRSSCIASSTAWHALQGLRGPTNPQALEAAIADVNRLENLPIIYPRHDPAARPVAWCTASRSPPCCCCWRPS
jgi:mxaC protein